MKKIDEMRNSLETLKTEVQNLLNENKVTDAKAKMEEVKVLKDAIALQEQLDAEEMEKVENKIKNDEGKINNMNKENLELGLIVAKAIAGTATQEELREIKNLMQEGTRENGGVTVPDDVRTKIIELQRKSFDIRKYINVEPVGTLKGSRPIEANEPNAAGFASVDEGADIQALHEPEFTELEYIVRKYAGYIPITNELLEDTAENILGFVQKWMAKNELNTYNYQVFNGTGVKAAEGIMTSEELDDVKEEVDFTSTTTTVIKKLKTVLNKDLEDLDSDNIVIFTK